MTKQKSHKRKTNASFFMFFRRKKSSRGGASYSAILLFLIIGVLIIAGMSLVNGLRPQLDDLKYSKQLPPSYSCCDSGDGDACKPNPDKSITYQGIKASAPEEYYLLKSNIYLRSQDHHIDPDPKGAKTPDGEQIFYNPRSEENKLDWAPECFSNITSPGKQKYGYDDFIFGPGSPNINPKNTNFPDLGCYAIPNEEIIYVCRKENASGECESKSGHAKFDAYFRAKDISNPGVPNVIKNCAKPDVTAKGGSDQQIINLPTPKGQSDLQLETFFIKEDPPVIDWMSPYCKPAIYLYPQKETNVTVKVEPKGSFTLTIPPYTKAGWNVTAFPDGRIVSDGHTYPYLYWEASMPDKVIKVPQDGYVVAYGDLSNLFTTILPQLGLNYTEAKAFKEYWLKALPHSPYYFVGILPEDDIDYMAPLTVSPKPNSVRRVSLYFKALEQKETVKAPHFAPFTRKGFTVIEWGGLFKADEKHKGFTCLM